MRKLPPAPLEAHGAMLRAITDYTNERLPWEPTGPDTTYVAVIRIDELTQLYAVPHNVITESQGAALAMADGTYLPVWLPDEDAPPGVLGDRVAVPVATMPPRRYGWCRGSMVRTISSDESRPPTLKISTGCRPSMTLPPTTASGADTSLARSIPMR